MTNPLSDSRQRPYIRYTDDQRRALYDRILRLRHGPFDDGEKAARWETIAEALRIARSTLSEWRSYEDFKQAEIRYRSLLRAETQSSAAAQGQEAFNHLWYLALNARSEFVQLEATKEVIRISKIDQGSEDAGRDASQELIEFQKVLQRRKERKAKLIEAGFDPDRKATTEVKPGGLLPDIVQAENRILAEEAAAKRSEGTT